MTLQTPVLELNVDIDDEGGELSEHLETGVFMMAGNVEVNERVEVRYPLGPELTKLNSIITSESGTKGAGRRGYYLDLGDGRHVFEINFLGWEGAIDSDGNAVPWGDTSEPSPSIYNATQADPTTQINVFQNYLRLGQFGSDTRHAHFRWGEYSDGTYARDGEDGLYEDYLPVAPISASFNRTSEQPVAYDGSITLIEMASWETLVDALANVQW